MFSQGVVYDFGEGGRIVDGHALEHGHRVAVDGQVIALGDDEVIANLHDAPVQIDFHFRNADHGGLAELACDQGRVAGPAALAGHDAFCREHAVHIVRLGLRPGQDHLFPFLVSPALGGLGVESDPAHGRAG